LVHDPVSLDAGLLTSPGDRSGCEDMAGGAPGFGPALLDPWESGLPPAYPALLDPWESGLPPAYPALVRATIGSRLHTNDGMDASR
jgi:hypothetical protein